MKLMFIMKAGVLSLVAACLFSCSGNRAAGTDKLECRPMKVEGGYGYVVLCGTDTLIYQPYIPAVSGKKAFATKEDARAIGRLVCRKLSAGEAPTIHCEEIAAAGIAY